MWFELLKQPQLGMGKVGLIDLSNVPEEQDDKCRRKLIEIYEFWKTYQSSVSNTPSSFSRRIEKNVSIRLNRIEEVPEEICCKFLSFLQKNILATINRDGEPFREQYKGFHFELSSFSHLGEGELYITFKYDVSPRRPLIFGLTIWLSSYNDRDNLMLKSQLADIAIFIDKQTKGF